jgi:hypothetical protein
MHHNGRRGPLVVFSAALVLLLGAASAEAHETKTVGSLRLTIGWGDEPAFSGLKNSIEVAVSDAAGAPVTDLADGWAVEVSFGDERVVLPLEPAHGRPGTFRAWLVPTRSGSYSFHFTGKARGQTIDTTSTCSDKAFSCVADAAALQFPVKDPSAAQLAERLTRTLPRAQQAADAAANARTMSLAAIVAAALALVAVIGLAVRKGRAGH